MERFGWSLPCIGKKLPSVFVARSMNNSCLAGGGSRNLINFFLCLFPYVFNKTCLSVAIHHLNDAVHWLDFGHFGLSPWLSFLSIIVILSSVCCMYCIDTVGQKLSVWLDLIWMRGHCQKLYSI